MKITQGFIVRLAVSIIFIAFGISEIINPNYWSVFLPKILSNLSFYLTIVVIHGAILLSVGILLIINYKRRIVAIIGSLILFAIVIDLVTSSGFTPLFVRDFVILLTTVSIIFEK